MMPDWYSFSLYFLAEEEPPTDPWEFIQWFQGASPIAYDEITLKKVEPKEGRPGK